MSDLARRGGPTLDDLEAAADAAGADYFDVVTRWLQREAVARVSVPRRDA